MALCRLDVVETRTLDAEKLVVNRQEMLADDMNVGVRQDVVDVGDPAGGRVLDRNHAEVPGAGRERREAILEGRAGDGLAIGIDL